MNVNKVQLLGRVSQDPEVRSTPSGQQVCNFNMATSRVWKDRATGDKKEQTEFHRVVAWGPTADIAGKYLLKGQLVYIEGRLQTRSWEGKDGGKRYTTEVVVENLQLGPKAGQGSGGGSYSGGSSNQASSKSATPTDDDDIPVIEEGTPTKSVGNESPGSDSDGVDESDVDLKDIPF